MSANALLFAPSLPANIIHFHKRSMHIRTTVLGFPSLLSELYRPQPTARRVKQTEKTGTSKSIVCEIQNGGNDRGEKRERRTNI